MTDDRAQKSPVPGDHKQQIQLSESTVDKFLTNQAEELNIKKQELEIRKQELDLKKQQDDHSYEYAKEALKAQVEDNKGKRSYFKDKRIHRYLFIVGLSVVVAVVICIAICLNKDQIAMEIIKAIAFLGAGGAGGYYMGKSKHPPPKNANDSTPE